MTSKKWALILGASSGFGAGAARRFATEGYDVIGIHLDRKSTRHMAEAVQEDVRKSGQEAVFFNINAADPLKIESTLDAIHEHFTGAEGENTIIALMHSLAFGTLLPFITADMKKVMRPKQLTMTTEVMANSLIYWVQGLIKRGMMSSGGRIIAMTSSGSRRCIPDYGAVSSAKAALESHVRQLSLELAPFNITANAVCAGVTDTDALRKIPINKKLARVAIDRNPHHRLGTVEEVADTIVGLCSPAFRWINGNTIHCDGGEDAVAVGNLLSDQAEGSFPPS